MSSNPARKPAKKQNANPGKTETANQGYAATCFWELVANETLYAARLVCAGPVATAPGADLHVAGAELHDAGADLNDAGAELNKIGLATLTVVHDRGSAADCIRTAFKPASHLTDVCKRLVSVLSSEEFENVAARRVTDVSVGIASAESPVSRTKMELRDAGCLEIEIGARGEYVTARLFDAGCGGATTWDVRLDATMLGVDPSGSSYPVYPPDGIFTGLLDYGIAFPPKSWPIPLWADELEPSPESIDLWAGDITAGVWVVGGGYIGATFASQKLTVCARAQELELAVQRSFGGGVVWSGETTTKLERGVPTPMPLIQGLLCTWTTASSSMCVPTTVGTYRYQVRGSLGASAYQSPWITVNVLPNIAYGLTNPTVANQYMRTAGVGSDPVSSQYQIYPGPGPAELVMTVVRNTADATTEDATTFQVPVNATEPVSGFTVLWDGDPVTPCVVTYSPKLDSEGPRYYQYMLQLIAPGGDVIASGWQDIDVTDNVTETSAYRTLSIERRKKTSIRRGLSVTRGSAL